LAEIPYNDILLFESQGVANKETPTILESHQIRGGETHSVFLFTRVSRRNLRMCIFSPRLLKAELVFADNIGGDEATNQAVTQTDEILQGDIYQKEDYKEL